MHWFMILDLVIYCLVVQIVDFGLFPSNEIRMIDRGGKGGGRECERLGSQSLIMVANYHVFTP